MDLKEKFFFLDDENPKGPKFLIKPLSESKEKQIMRESQVRRPKGHGPMDMFNDRRAGEKKIRATVLGWEKLRKQDLLDMDVLRPATFDEWKQAFKGMDFDAEIEFNEKNLEILAQHYDKKFMGFLNTCHDDLEQIRKRELQEELKNW